MFGDFKGQLKERYLQGPEEILTTFEELWVIIIFDELQMVFEPWGDRLRWIIEHEGEHFRK
jgi:hypothetical protein